MLSVNYISGSNNLLFDYTHSRYILENFKVNHTVDNFINKGYNQHGSTYIKSLMDELDVSLTFLLHAEKDEDIYKLESRMMAAFFPDGLKTLEVTTSAYKRALDVYIVQPPTITDNYGRTRKYEVKMRAPVPFYRDVEFNTKNFSDAVGGLTFDLAFNYGTAGVQFGQEGRSAEITNYGVKSAPVIIEMSGARMVNPTLNFVGDSFSGSIGINYTVGENEKIIIRTGYGEKDVTLVREDGSTVSVTRYLTEGSTWVELPVGDIKVDSSISEGSLNINMKWYNYYAA